MIVKIKTDMAPDTAPTQVLLGLILGKIFVLPNFEPKIKAAESQIQTERNISNVYIAPDISHPVSIYLILRIEFINRPIQTIPKILIAIFSIGFTFFLKTSNESIKIVEWPELIESKPKDRIDIQFKYSKLINSREVKIVGFGKWKDYKFDEI